MMSKGLNQQRDYKRILIVKAGDSNSGGVGEQFLQAMLTKYPKTEIFRFSLVRSISVDCSDSRFKTYKIQSSSLPILSSLNYWIFQRRNLKESVNTIIQMVSHYNIAVIWIIMNSLELIQLSSKLSDLIKTPIIVQVWDTPEYLAQSSHLDYFSKKSLFKKFRNTLSKAQYGATISDLMGKIYYDRFNLKSKTLFFVTPISDYLYFNRDKKIHSEEIQIVFAGSLYAYDSWNAFLDAIELHNSKNTNNKVKVRCIGSISRRARKRNWVIYEELMTLNDAMAVINKSHIAYLPYWMNKKYSYAVQTAFPSKLSFYASSGTPILYHGPENSTPTDFLKKYPIGLNCHSLEASDILKTVDKLLSKDFLQQYPKIQSKVIEEVFNPTQAAEVFKDILNTISDKI